MGRPTVPTWDCSWRRGRPAPERVASPISPGNDSRLLSPPTRNGKGWSKSRGSRNNRSVNATNQTPVAHTCAAVRTVHPDLGAKKTCRRTPDHLGLATCLQPPSRSRAESSARRRSPRTSPGRDSADARPTAVRSTPDLVASPLRLVPGRSTVTAHEMRLDPRAGRTRLDAWPMTATRFASEASHSPVREWSISSSSRSIPSRRDATFVAVDGEGRETILPRPELLAFAGSVDGDPDSDAFLAFGPSGVEGWIKVDGIAFGVSDGVADGPVLIHRLDALPPLDRNSPRTSAEPTCSPPFRTPALPVSWDPTARIALPEHAVAR